MLVLYQGRTALLLEGSCDYYVGMDAVEEVKARLSIEDVISEYVQLKRAGRNFKGLSPFNAEKTPSFVVSPEKQIWHDFSSGRGGNVFSFVMEMEAWISVAHSNCWRGRQVSISISMTNGHATPSSRKSCI
jgi:hypothetical protein